VKEIVMNNFNYLVLCAGTLPLTGPAFAQDTALSFEFNDAGLAEAHTNLDFSATYYPTDAIWNIGAFARNVLDEQILTNGSNHNFSDAFVATPQPRRSFGVRVAAEF